MQNHDKLTKDSLRELLGAVRHVMVDVWQNNRLLISALFATSLLTALAPFAVRGAEALLLNHLVKLYGQGQFDPLILLLITVSVSLFLLQGGMYALLRYYDKISWFQIQQRHDVSFSQKLASLDIATHEDSKFQDQLQLVREYGESYAVARVLNNMVANIQNVMGFSIALSIVAVADWRFLVLILLASLPRLYAETKYGQQIWSIHQSKSESRRMYQEVKRQTHSATAVREMQTFQTVSFFIDRHRKVPFFLYLAFGAMHSPHQSPPRGRFSRRTGEPSTHSACAWHFMPGRRNRTRAGTTSPPHSIASRACSLPATVGRSSLLKRCSNSRVVLSRRASSCVISEITGCGTSWSRARLPTVSSRPP